MNKHEVTYLMIGGTLLPAFAAVYIYSLIAKRDISLKDVEYLSIFAIASIIGGYYTAKILKK